MIQKFSTKFAIFILVVIAICAVGGYFAQKQMEKDMIKNVDAQVQAMLPESGLKDPEAVQKRMAEVSAESLALLPSEEARKDFVIDSFLGFYFMNTRARVQFCEDLGVDMTPFVAVFNEMHQNELAIIKKANALADLDPTWQRLQHSATYLNIIDMDMKAASAALKRSETEVCQLLTKPEARPLIERMHFSYKFPEQWQILMKKSDQ